MSIAAKFVTGDIFRHIWVMTTTSAIGLMAMFLVELLDMLFLSMLDIPAIVAGVGFAASLSFFIISINIGLTISMAALVSRALGMRQPEHAKQLASDILIVIACITTVIAIAAWFNIRPLLELLGAQGEPLEYGIRYLQILLPSQPILALGMAMSAAVRASGDAKLAMYATLLSSVVNAILDPIFIFVLDMGVEGAAWSSFIARFSVLVVGFYGVVIKHRLIKRTSLSNVVKHLGQIFNVAGPAMVTNVVTPIGNAIVIKAMSQFGDSYIAAFSIVSRLSPVAFGLVFALSGAVAPIIGQNYGAKLFARIRETLNKSLIFNAVYVAGVSCILALACPILITVFALDDDGAQLMRWFCFAISFTFIFNGAQFVANAAFNNLDRPMLATLFNALRATLFTLPFVWAGALLAGPVGVLVGQAIGGIIIAAISVYVAYWHLARLEKSNSELA